MNGYLLTFYTSESAHHENKRVVDWLIDTAKTLGVEGATVSHGVEGFGASGRLHAARFFELADDPTEVAFAVSTQEGDALMDKVKAAAIPVFYVRMAAEFGRV